jgi:extradiol dioxygenase family protein
MATKTAIRDFYGKILGWVEEEPNGDQIIRDFYGKILRKYDKKSNVTRDFYGRILTTGNTAISALYNK